MRSTLFYIPGQFHGMPVFGLGWLLLAWVLLCLGFSIWQSRRDGGVREVAGLAPLFLVVAAAIAFLLPNLVEVDSSGRMIGLPVRGYGVMLMLATVAAVGLAAYRASQVGIDPEKIYALAFVMFIAGILGARLFFVIEYWNEDFSPSRTGSLVSTLKAIINVPQGGLVVYGSFLFGVPAGVWFCFRHHLRVLALGDIVAPSMALGQALGRIGCFLNGCCFGSVCLEADYAITFPSSSPPYVQQEQSGWHSGVWLEKKEGRITAAYIAPHGPASQAGLRAGDEIISINGVAVSSSLPEARRQLAAGKTSFELETADGRVLRWLAGEGPPRSVPIHATQLYAAIDAGLLALVLWFFFPYRRHDGEVFALLITLHPLSRFLLERIRVDEPGQFGSDLSISQWLSFALLAAAVGLWIYIERRPPAHDAAASP